MAKRKLLGTHLVGWLAAIASVTSLIVWFSMREEALEVTAAPAERSHVEETVTAIAAGTVVADGDVRLAPEMPGTVSEIHFEDGDSVSTGDVLLELRHDELDAQLALAEANLRVGESRVQQAKLGAQIYAEISDTQVRQSLAQLEQARSDFSRTETLSERKAISRSDYERAQLALRVAEETAAAAEASRRETLVRTEEVRSAELSLEQLRAAVAAATAAREKALLRAPFDGVLADVMVDAGESVAPGMPVLHLINTRGCYVEAPFDEANYAQIGVGQRARINLDAYRNVDFEGVVEFVSPAVTMNADLSRTVNARIRVRPEDAPKFLPGMSADTVIISDERDGALSVPTGAIILGRYVFVVEGDRAVRRDIETGIGNWARTEVLSGVDEDDAVITSIGAKELADGVRVRVAPDEEMLL